MKVPYLNKKIDEEFDAYLTEFEQSVSSKVSSLKTTAGSKQLFATLYPLFALLRVLIDSKYVRNPSREIVLSELKSSGNKQLFVEAVATFNKSSKFSNELKIGLQRQNFNAYFDELFSDSLLLLNSFYMGNYRGAQIALRCMLEDLYRHLYYKDHQEEFWALSSNGGGLDEHNIKISPKELRDYLTRTSYLKIFRNLTKDFISKSGDLDGDLFSENEKLYSDCSSYVHGSLTVTMNSFKSNYDLQIDAAKSQELNSAASSFVSMAVAFLLAAHLDNFLALSDYDKSIVLGAFSKKRRAAFRRALNV
ncbi:hypothetical protein RF679_13400 [Undibacterium cyanobacteriorum]|uniref:Apea-like HEPN domain-containing protein n=1 Tax=Undibacterium cyanobacteriorum TaxID=3073561 RepID=A0ABY9REJ0_9BURK|nr:hypothetical protein [Undibacterium sp. 20NA77.5]WMW79641.1 hypothetical protein RF679_13400 [Undibacterium sp. 20NA77.5]